jgi:hypothetical protein
MARYKIWDKQEDIFTIGQDEHGRSRWTAAEYLIMRPWAAQADTKVIIGGGKINGTVFMEFDSAVEHYKRLGADIHDDMNDREVLDAIEAFENKTPEPCAQAEDHIAAAMEFDNLQKYGCGTFDIVKRDYDLKLWSKPMVRCAADKGAISEEEYKIITGEDYK